MSTRANLIVEYKDKQKFYYKHHDGYPKNGFGDDILNFLNIYNTNEPYEWTFENVVGLIDIGVLGYKLEDTDSIHGDISYVYILDVLAKSLECQHWEFVYNEQEPLKSCSKLKNNVYKKYI